MTRPDAWGRGGASVSAWAQLVRLPNLFTAPGDPVVGAFIASLGSGIDWSALAIASAASVCAYAGGLIDNDLADSNEDRADRPDRPLPSGRVSYRTAVFVRFFLIACPFALWLAFRLPVAWLTVHAVLALTILAYNRVKKRRPWTGVTLMGLCRGLNVASGALAISLSATSGRLLVAIATWFLYIAGVSLFARRETARAPGRIRYALPLALLPLAVVALSQRTGAYVSVKMSLGLVVAALYLAMALRRCPSGSAPSVVQGTVGRLVRALIVIQALTVLAFPNGLFPGAGLLCAWAAAEFTAKRFYCS